MKKRIWIPASLALLLVILYQGLMYFGPMRTPWERDYDRAAYAAFLEECEQILARPWMLGVPRITVNPDSSREYRWLYKAGPDSTEIRIRVLHQAAMRPRQVLLKTESKVKFTTEGWKQVMYR